MRAMVPQGKAGLESGSVVTPSIAVIPLPKV